jgi:uncharacterized membrane protein/protein-disulfide isomerase
MGLSMLALALSTYLSWHYVVGGSVIGCDGGSPCNQMLTSRWSTVAGVLPVSGLAVGAYMTLLAAMLFIGPSTPSPVRRLAWSAMLVLVGSAAGSALWFIIVQKWIIGAFCPYCMTAHITGLLLTVLVIWRASMQLNDDSTDVLPKKPAVDTTVSSTASPRLISPLTIAGLILFGLVTAAILATCQIAFTPPVVYRDGESQMNLPVIDTHTAPLVGSPEARYIVNLLFDYKCPHCQKLHFMLDEAIRRYGGKLAFVLCPTPLNTRCNPYIPQQVDEFKDSCELAKVGLAVWMANHEAFSSFDNWMFTLESGDRWLPRSLDAAMAKAVELVGQTKFDAALADPWIDRYLQTTVQIYSLTGNGVPRLVYGTRWVNPELNNVDDLMMILQNSLGLPTP